MAKGKDVRAGGAYVELFSDAAKLSAGLAAGAALLKGFGGAVLGVGSAIAGVGASIIGTFGATVATATEVGSELKDASDRTGLAVEELSALKHAAEQSASGLEDLEKAFRHMQIKGHGMGLEDFINLADEVANSTNPAATAFEVFGKAGQALLPMLKGGHEGIEKLMEEAQRLGLVMSGEDAAAAEQFGDELAILEKQSKALRVAIGSALIPILQDMVGPVKEFGAIVIDVIKVSREQFKTLSLDVGSSFSEIKEITNETFGGVKDSLKSGSLEDAGKVAMAGLKAAWLTGLKEMHLAWADFWNSLPEALKSFTDKIRGDKTYSIIATILSAGMKDGILKGYDEALKAIGSIDKDKISQDYQTRIDAARKDLTDLRNQAAAKVPPKTLPAGKPGAHERNLASLADMAKGTFSSSAVSQSLATSDKFADKIAKDTKRAADAAEEVSAKIEKLAATYA